MAEEKAPREGGTTEAAEKEEEETDGHAGEEERSHGSKADFASSA